MQHWVNNTYFPVTGTVDPIVGNNIAHKSKMARKGMHFQASRLASSLSPVLVVADPCDSGCLQARIVGRYDDAPAEASLRGNLLSFGNVYFGAREVSGPEFIWGRGVMLENEDPAVRTFHLYPMSQYL